MVRISAVFEELYKAAVEADEDVKLQSMADLIMKELEQHGMSEKVILHSKSVGVHPSNRGGKMLSPIDVHVKGAKIVKGGFSWRLCSDDEAICVSDGPGKAIAKAIVNLAKSSTFFAKYIDLGSIKAGSVGCGHLNQFLAAVHDEAETDQQSLKGDGKNTISKRKLCDADENLKLAVDRGLQWTLIRAEVETAFPKLPDILQKALNVKHAVAQSEQWDEQLLQVAKKVTESFTTMGMRKIDWEWVERSVAMGQSPHLRDLPARIKFCKRWGGGHEQTFTK